MPTPQTISLAESHRTAQRSRLGLIAALVAARFIQQMTDGSDAQVRGWLSLVLPSIESERAQSARRAARFYAAARLVESGGELEVPQASAGALSAPQAALTTSLVVTGPVALRRLLREGRLPQEAAVRQAASAAGGAAVRHVGNGGRETLRALVEGDQRAVGYVRHTRARPCWFCAMLASRGPVYKDDSFDDSDPRFESGGVSGDVKVHDRCQCFLVPMFSRGGPMPGATDEFAKLWAESTKGTTGAGMRTAFRRAYTERYAVA